MKQLAYILLFSSIITHLHMHPTVPDNVSGALISNFGKEAVERAFKKQAAQTNKNNLSIQELQKSIDEKHNQLALEGLKDSVVLLGFYSACIQQANKPEDLYECLSGEKIISMQAFLKKDDHLAGCLDAYNTVWAEITRHQTDHHRGNAPKIPSEGKMREVLQDKITNFEKTKEELLGVLGYSQKYLQARSQGKLDAQAALALKEYFGFPRERELDEFMKRLDPSFLDLLREKIKTK